MMSSIRKRLLSLLMITMVIVLAFIALGNYYLDRGDIEHHLDAMLGEAAFAFQALVGNDLLHRNIPELQQKLNNIPVISKSYLSIINNKDITNIHERFQFQVWNDSLSKLIIHSAHAPFVPFTNGTNGFSWITIHGQTWRVFTASDPINHTIFCIGERDDVRAEIGNIIARDDFLIALLAFPLLALAIWIVISRSLRPLQTISSEVASRVPGYLEPVKVQYVPSEIRPLVDEINKLLLRLNRALDREKRFAGDAAHELRTPLAALKAQVQLIIATQTQNPDMAEHTQRLLATVDRSSHIIEQLLTLSRIIPEATEGFHDFTSVDLHRITTETLALLVPHALEKSIELSLECPDGPVMLNANTTMLGILIRNLVDNAIRYSPEHSEVLVNIEKTPQAIILSVADNGPGIPPELRSRVFERFYRILGTNTQGTGLGLAIVQQIASLHQAEVRLGAGVEGRGLTVTITLPLNLPTTSASV